MCLSGTQIQRALAFKGTEDPIEPNSKDSLPLEEEHWFPDFREVFKNAFRAQ